MIGPDKNVYEYDVETSTWTKYTSNGDPPQHDVEADMAYYNGRLYLYGGRNANYDNDLRLYSYDFTTQTWSGLTTTNSPNERETHGMVVYEDYLYVLPGWNSREEYDDGEIKRINLKTGSTKWETLKVDSDSETKAFFPRDSYSCVKTGSFVYFSCGWREDGILNDVVKLDLSQSPLKYEKLSDNYVSPPSRTQHSLEAIGTKLYMFGGKGEAGK
jgi:N-acetylneuraminic acid mutarotase